MNLHALTNLLVFSNPPKQRHLRPYADARIRIHLTLRYTLSRNTFLHHSEDGMGWILEQKADDDGERWKAGLAAMAGKWN